MQFTNSKVAVTRGMLMQFLMQLLVRMERACFVNGQNLYLKDKQTGIINNFNEGFYLFEATVGESASSFEIIYQAGNSFVYEQ